jgi:glycosyl transferase family 2
MNRKASTSLPLVTVVIPAYNHAGYLREAVRSVLNQSYPQIELIVIDDGSTDDTAHVLATLDGDFRWFSQDNSGQSQTLARGWDEARGEILAYLSADDCLESQAVEVAVAALQADAALAAVYPDFNLIDPASNVVRRVEAPDFDYAAMLSNVICPIGPGAFFRRSSYRQAGPWRTEFRQMPDYDFWLRMGLTGPIKRMPQVLASFRVHPGSQTYSVTTESRADEVILIIDDLLASQLAAAVPEDLAREARISAFLVSAQLHIRAGRFRVAVDRLKRAVDTRRNALISIRTLRLLFNAMFNRISHRLLWTIRSLLKPGGGHAG